MAATRGLLLGHPELILADEPTSALDFDHRERFIQLLFDVCQKRKHQFCLLAMIVRCNPYLIVRFHCWISIRWQK